MQENEIKKTLMGIVDNIVQYILPPGDELSPTEKFNIILSESLQTLALVTSIEDEFNIQFEDDEMDALLFGGLDSTVQKISQQLTVKSHDQDQIAEKIP
jgi:acyl carrier protein